MRGSNEIKSRQSQYKENQNNENTIPDSSQSTEVYDDLFVHGAMDQISLQQWTSGNVPNLPSPSKLLIPTISFPNSHIENKTSLPSPSKLFTETTTDNFSQFDSQNRNELSPIIPNRKKICKIKSNSSKYKDSSVKNYFDSSQTVPPRASKRINRTQDTRPSQFMRSWLGFDNIKPSNCENNNKSNLVESNNNDQLDFLFSEKDILIRKGSSTVNEEVWHDDSLKKRKTNQIKTFFHQEEDFIDTVLYGRIVIGTNSSLKSIDSQQIPSTKLIGKVSGIMAFSICGYIRFVNLNEEMGLDSIFNQEKGAFLDVSIDFLDYKLDTMIE